MTIPNNFAFTPTTGLRDTSTFPTVPASEADLRNAVQTPSDQLRDFINNTLLPLLGTSMNLTGATAPTRYVGGTTSGAPTTGTFAVGDFVIDQSGMVWICKVAGTPGTWVKPIIHSQTRTILFRYVFSFTTTSNTSMGRNATGLQTFKFNANEWTNNQFYAECTANVGSNTGYFGVWDLTVSAPVSGSEISLTSGTYFARSGSFALTDGHEYGAYGRTSSTSVSLNGFDILQLL